MTVVPPAPETLLEQALALPAADRARLASGLLDSLDERRSDEGDVERLWSEETARRAAQLDAGEVRVTTWDELTQRVDELRAPTTDE